MLWTLLIIYERIKHTKYEQKLYTLNSDSTERVHSTLDNNLVWDYPEPVLMV